MEPRPPAPEEISGAVLTNLKSMLGPQVTAVLLRELQENYFGEMDAKAVIVQKPELFEKVLAGRGRRFWSLCAKRSTPSSTLTPV